MNTPEEDQFVPIYSAANSFDAHVLKSKLLAADIECRVDNDGLQGIQGEVPFGITTSPQVWVRQIDVDAAWSLLGTTQKADLSTDGCNDDSGLDHPDSEENQDRIPETRSLREWAVVAILLAVCAFTAWGLFKSEQDSAASDFRWEAYRAMDRGELEVALRHFSKAIETNPSDGSLYGDRGYIHHRLRKYKEAIQDYSQALETGPDEYKIIYLFNRAASYQESGEYSNAKLDYESVLKRKPDDVECRNALAWLLATCPDETLRDGLASLAHGRKCLDDTDEPGWHLLDTLAVAQAECGRFEEAVKTQLRVVELAPIEEKDSCRQTLDSYRKGVPYRMQEPDSDL